MVSSWNIKIIFTNFSVVEKSCSSFELLRYELIDLVKQYGEDTILKIELENANA